MQKTPIEWTDYSANPLKFRDAEGRTVWGCVHASPGCVNCYAETLAKRYGRGGLFNVQTMANLTPYLCEKELKSMLTAKVPAGSRCFVGDMTDIFGPWVPDELLDKLFHTFAARPDVNWQVLTKRADRMREYLNDPQRAPSCWPLRHVWLGVSTEDMTRAAERLPKLRDTNAYVRFVSAEPLLGGIDLLQATYADMPFEAREQLHPNDLRVLDWVIVGGESGVGARTTSFEAVLSIVNQCQASRVACFVKQLGSKPTYQGNRLDIPKGKGNNPDDWQPAIRVREFPAADGSSRERT